MKISDLATSAIGGVTSFFSGWQGLLVAFLIGSATAGYGAWTVKDWKDSGTITSLQGQVAHWKSQTGTANGNTATAWNSYDRCMSSLGYLKKQSDMRTSSADAELERLRAGKAASDAKVARLLAAKPAPGADLCKAADDLILENAQ